MSGEKKKRVELKDGKLSLRFGIEDFTKEEQDRLLREEIVELLADRDIGIEELVWKLRKLYIQAGSPEGPGREGLIKWLENV